MHAWHHTSISHVTVDAACNRFHYTVRKGANRTRGVGGWDRVSGVSPGYCSLPGSPVLANWGLRQENTGVSPRETYFRACVYAARLLQFDFPI